jgi:hypothetical protein
MKKSDLVKIIKEAITSKQVLKEEKSVDQLMSDLGDAILADNNEAMKVAFKNLKTGLIGRIKNKAQDLKGHLDKKYTEESVNEGLLNSFSDYDTVFEMARHKAIPFAAVGILLVKYGIAKAKELIKGGKEEVMNAIEDSPKEEPSTMPTKRPIKLFKNKKYTNENYEEADDEFDTGGYVEAMGPELDKHVKAIAGIFQEWENGPSTEPGMVGYATYDLIEYIKRAIRR